MPRRGALRRARPTRVRRGTPCRTRARRPSDADPRGAAFVNERLAAGAGELRDFIVAAWTASGSASIGWPAVKVAEVEAGTADPWIAMVGED